METRPKPASPGIYMLWFAGALLTIILAWMIGEVVVERMVGPEAPAAIAPTVE